MLVRSLIVFSLPLHLPQQKNKEIRCELKQSIRAARLSEVDSSTPVDFEDGGHLSHTGMQRALSW